MRTRTDGKGTNCVVFISWLWDCCLLQNNSPSLEDDKLISWQCKVKNWAETTASLLSLYMTGIWNGIHFRGFVRINISAGPFITKPLFSNKFVTEVQYIVVMKSKNLMMIYTIKWKKLIILWWRKIIWSWRFVWWWWWWILKRIQVDDEVRVWHDGEY